MVLNFNEVRSKYSRQRESLTKILAANWIHQNQAKYDTDIRQRRDSEIRLRETKQGIKT